MQQIRKNVLYNVLLNVSRVIFPFITAPYISRVLEPDGLGLFDFSNYYASFFAMVALLGIPVYGVREVAKKRSEPETLKVLVSELFSISVWMTLGISIIYIASLFVVGQLMENKVIFLLAGITLYLAPLRTEWFFQGIEKFGFITTRSLIIKTISIICLFLFVRTKTDLIIYVILNALSTAASDLWNYVKIIQEGVVPRLVFKGLGKHMRPVLLLFASTLAISIYTMLDTEMLGFLTDQVGYYGRATNISRILISVVTSISVVVIPRVAQSAETGNFEKILDIVTKSLAIVSLLAIPMSVGIACISKDFVPLFYGSLFEGSVLPLMIVGILVSVIAFSNIMANQILIGMGHDRCFLRCVVFGSITNVLLNLLLIPRLGAVGASIASVLAEIMVLTASLFFVYRKTPIRVGHSRIDIVKSLVGSILFVPLYFVLRSCLSGWLLVIVFTLSGFVVFMVAQMLMHHSGMDLLLDLAKGRIKRGNE